MNRLLMPVLALLVLFAVNVATPTAYALESVPAVWNHGLSITTLVDYKKGEYLVLSDIWTGTLGRDASIRHSLQVKVESLSKAFTATQAATDKAPKETLTVTLVETDNPTEFAAHFEHTVGEGKDI